MSLILRISPGRPFLSTPSARRATARQRTGRAGRAISIHALRKEGDRLRGALDDLDGDFYPRPPQGGRLIT